MTRGQHQQGPLLAAHGNPPTLADAGVEGLSGSGWVKALDVVLLPEPDQQLFRGQFLRRT